MLKRKVIVIFICLTLLTSLRVFAQYNTINFSNNWGNLSGCEDTDGDGNKELIFLSGYGVKIVDASSGVLEWESVGFVYQTNFEIIDFNNDGVFEIYFYKSSVPTACGIIMYSGNISDNNTVGEYKQILHQNYPNPFNPETTIDYQLKKSGYVELKIYNIKGQLVQTLLKDEQPAGKHSIVWNAKGFSSGQYFYQIKVDGKTVQTKKAIFLK